MSVFNIKKLIKVNLTNNYNSQFLTRFPCYGNDYFK